MSLSRKTVLLADDEDTLREGLTQVLSEEGFHVIACRDGAEALATLKKHTVHAIITDLRMPGLSGMELIERATKQAPEAGVIVITAFGEVETAVEAMKRGAKDYLCKPLLFDELVLKLNRLLAQDDIARQNEALREQIMQNQAGAAVVARSQAMQQILAMVRRVAETMSNVLITGESGTGKEVVARALHHGGITADKPFMAVNCGGLVENLVESQLFGHRRGAFTGAQSDHVGFFEAADGGTLFLDEIGNLPLTSQAVLLRAIEEKAVTPVGDNHPRPVNIRIIAATHRDVETAVAAREFREDLYFRLNVVRLTIPPLRERPEDIPALVELFVHKCSSELKRPPPCVTQEAMTALCAYSWPGNVRELENVIERTMIFAEGDQIGCQAIAALLPIEPGAQPPTSDLRMAAREFERRHILKVLRAFGNNKVAAAQSLGIALSSLYRKIEELGIEKAPAETEKVS